MAKVADFPPVFPPAPAVMAILARFDRSQLNGFIAVAIDLADALDGDPETEGDPLEEGEPAFDPRSRELANLHSEGAGCSISGDAEPDVEDAAAWIERVDQSKSPLTGSAAETASEEDIEDDDPAGDAELTDDSPGFGKADRQLANGYYGQGAGCVISDPDVEHDGCERENWAHSLDHPAELRVGDLPNRK